MVFGMSYFKRLGRLNLERSSLVEAAAATSYTFEISCQQRNWLFSGTAAGKLTRSKLLCQHGSSCVSSSIGWLAVDRNCFANTDRLVYPLRSAGWQLNRNRCAAITCASLALSFQEKSTEYRLFFFCKRPNVHCEEKTENNRVDDGGGAQ
jgi:hypothetical protein